MSKLWYDVKYALRSLRRSPGFTGTCIAILAIGTGMAMAMVTIVDAVLLQRLPVREQDRIAVIRVVRDPSVTQDISYSDLQQLRRESRSLLGIAGVQSTGAVQGVSIDADSVTEGQTAWVTTNFFDVLGARPALGHFFQPDDADAIAGHALVISYKAWLRKFGGSPDVIGHHVVGAFDHATLTIVGVAPPGLDYPTGVDYWSTFADAQAPALTIVGRLAPGATLAAAQSEAFAVFNRVEPQRHADRADGRTFTTEVLGDVRPSLVVLLAAVGLLLLIACVNVSNLLLLRASKRGHELAIRRAIGASYGDIVRQLLAENVALAVGGGALGIVCAEALLRALLAVAPSQLPRTDVIRLAGAPLGVALGTTIATALILGVVPAFVAARADLGTPLRIDSRSGAETRGRRRARQSLVALQMALAVLTLSGAGILVHSLERLQRLNLGYRADHLSIFGVAVPGAKYGYDPAKRNALGEAVDPVLSAVPGVTSLTPVRLPPFVSPAAFSWKFALDGQSNDEAAFNPSVALEFGDPEYFHTFGIPLLQGRGFTEHDWTGAPLVVVISESVARRFWPGQNPVGKRLRNFTAAPYAWRTVIGVVGDAHLRALRDSTPTLYMPWRQAIWSSYIAVRTTGDIASVLPAMRRALHNVDPELLLWDVKTMDDYLAVPLAVPRLSALLLSGFALVALLLAAIGLYGVMASVVRDQTREIGIRIALGARPAALTTRFMQQGLAVGAVGAAVGLAGALACTRFLRSLVFGVSTVDPATLGAATLVLLVVVAIAAYVPSRRVARVDPVDALRSD